MNTHENLYYFVPQMGTEIHNMQETTQPALALKKQEERTLRQKSHSRRNGNKIRTVAQITVEWTPDLIEKQHNDVDLSYGFGEHAPLPQLLKVVT